MFNRASIIAEIGGENVVAIDSVKRKRRSFPLRYQDDGCSCSECERMYTKTETNGDSDDS